MSKKKKKAPAMTSEQVYEHVQTHLEEILEQLGDWQELEVRVPVGDPEPHLLVYVPPERAAHLPPAVTVSTEFGLVEIPLKVFHDYAPYQALSS